ncbi:VanZ family protein [Paenibacillus lutrae]|uniref:VanZ family protein n=1 Tax=Paenibacillus lutrae TaxID=2078573 RepID=UPI001F271366|nr:VanZ family protein [Paenibacillus lutrae]
MPVLLWTLLVFDLSQQTFREQSIQPFLHKLVPKEEIHAYIPDVTVRYSRAVIDSQSEPYRFVEFLFRKTAHLVVYAVLALFAYAALYPHGMKRPCMFIISLLYVTAIALCDEWVQSAAAMRTSAIQDVVLDTAGGIVGLGAAVWVVPWGSRFVRRRFSSRRWNADL